MCIRDRSIPLKRTTDILQYLGQHRRPGQVICGFSMETRDMLENSRAKLEKKNVDMICANNLKVAGAGFGTDTNVITLDVYKRQAQHSLGVGAHLQQLAGVFIHGHHGGLAQNNALSLDVYQNRGGAQVDPDVFAKQIKHSLPPYYDSVTAGASRRLSCIQPFFIITAQATVFT